MSSYTYVFYVPVCLENSEECRLTAVLGKGSQLGLASSPCWDGEERNCWSLIWRKKRHLYWPCPKKPLTMGMQQSLSQGCLTPKHLFLTPDTDWVEWWSLKWHIHFLTLRICACPSGEQLIVTNDHLFLKYKWIRSCNGTREGCLNWLGTHVSPEQSVYYFIYSSPQTYRVGFTDKHVNLPWLGPNQIWSICLDKQLQDPRHDIIHRRNKHI